MQNIYDVTIIGGGPAGLYSAFYAGLRDLKTKIIEYKSVLGGKIHVYPEKLIWDIGALPATPGQEVIDNLVQQGLTFEPTVCLNTKVDVVSKENELFVITTSSGNKHYSKSVIVAVGGGIISPIKLDLEGAEKFEVSNLHYTIRGIHRFKDKSLLISGGGNSAIDWACDLLGIAKDITIIYRGDELPAHEAQVKKLREYGVPIITQAAIKKLVANEAKTKIQQVIVENRQTNEISELTVDEVLINHGYDRDQSFSFDASLAPERDKERQYFLVTDTHGQTSIPGLYAAGDIVQYDGKIHLIAGAFQDAVHAVNSIKLMLEPEANKMATVSSHNETFESRNREIIKQTLVKA